MRRVQVAVPLLVAFIMCCAGSAYAGMIGSTVTSQYYVVGGVYNTPESPTTFVANGTIQETFCASGCSTLRFNLTVTNNQIIYALTGVGPWSPSVTSLNSGGLFITNGNLLTFSGVTITGVTLDASSTVPGFTSSHITFNASNIAVDWQNLGTGGQQVVLDVTSSGNASSPEPAEWITVLTGVAAIGLWRRFRLRSTV
jgi:hypothetical protein